MAPSRSGDPCGAVSPPRLDAADQGGLLDIAEWAIREGLQGRPGAPEPDDSWTPVLRLPAGCFVTLEVGGELNGCIGSVVPAAPLGISAARHAHAAAFEDPRLPRLRQADYDRLEIEISVLSALEPIPAGTREQLVGSLVPRVDGLVLGAGEQLAVFLPSVWDQLPAPHDFVDRLWFKAGIMPGPWPATARASRFTVQSFARAAS